MTSRIDASSMVAFTVFCVLGAAGEAPAQTASGQSDQSRGTLEEVVVTATKRTEKLQDVPLAIAAVGSDDLRALNAQNFTDYSRTIPGLSFQDLGDGRERVAIRGLAPTTGDPTVAYYIGETPLPPARGNLGRTQANPELVDIERIEVLRGPQGTLYGAGSVGGTIRLIPAAPDLRQYSGFAQAGGGWTEGGAASGSASFAANAPLVPEAFAARLAAWYRVDQGYISRLVGPDTLASPPTRFQSSQSNIPGTRGTGFRLTALYVPSDAVSISALIHNEQHFASDINDITGGATNPTDRLTQIMLTETLEPQSDGFTLYDITAKVELPGATVTSATSYSLNRLHASEETAGFIDAFFSGHAPFPSRLEEWAHDDSFTQELRVATSHPIGRVSGILGGYYNNVDGTRSQFFSPPGWNAEFAPLGPNDPSGLYAPGNNLFTYAGPNGGPAIFKYGEFAVFGELSVAVTSQLSITGGLRHYNIHTLLDQVESGLFNGGTTVINTSGHFSGTVKKGNISYQATPSHLLYLQYSEGFRPGFGIGALPASCNADLAAIGLTTTPTEVNPDTIKNYEVGAKTMWLDRRLTVNVAAYRIKWTGIQQGLQLPCGFTLEANAGSATSNGGELEAKARVSTNFEVGVSASRSAATLDNDEPSFGALRGDQLLNVPVWQAATYVTYRFVPLAGIDGSVRLDLEHTASSHANYARLPGTSSRDPAFALSSLTLLNTRIGFVKGRWDVGLVGKNLTNNLARADRQVSIAADDPGRPRYVINRPRTVGIDVRVAF